MVRRKIGTTLAACGLVMLFFGMGALPAQGAEPVSVALQPSPRPAVEQDQQPGGAKSDSGKGAGVATGHITGTVIDLRTGAPAAGITVNVGGALVTTDSNGNYDHWLPVGSYAVALDLSSQQGEAAQGPAFVEVQAESATVQHLNFLSPAAPTSAPTSAPAVASTSAPVEATAVVQAVGRAKAPAPKPDAMPARLPRTGAEGSGAWLWLGFGMMLLIGGGIVGFGPVLNGRSAAGAIRAHASNLRLLQSLLAAPARSERASDDLLAALLEGAARARGAARKQ